MSEFEQKVVFVTGAASGIGQAQAQAFLAEGAYVFGVDCQSDFGPLVNDEFFQSYCADLSRLKDCQAAVNACQKKFGSIDILLNTAGILDAYRNLEETDFDSWHQVLATNLNSLFYLTKLWLPLMLEKEHATIINMASIAGLVAGGGGIAYTTSKHAIVGFTKQLALDYADQGLHVNAIAPGAIHTPMNAADFAGDGEIAQKVASETPLKRWAQPAEVAQLTLFLASQRASYLQGNIVPIDGGWLLK